MSVSYTEKSWSELTHAYGSAEDVPALLAELESDDKQTREDALAELFGNIWHQGTVYPATAKALPALIDLLRSPTCKDLDSIAALVASIANGDGYYSVHSRLESLREDFERILVNRGSSVAKEIEKEADYLNVIREMSLAALPVLQPFLDSSYWCVREAVVGVYRRYAEHFSDAFERLERRLSVETHEDVRERIEEALTELKRTQEGSP